MSQQYIKNCNAHGFKCEDNSVGTRLVTDMKYFRSAGLAVYEIGAKLGHVLWRKFAPDEQEKADTALNEHGLRLIFNRQYDLAERLLTFGVRTVRNHPSDRTRRMMVINLANAVRLQDRQPEANKLLASEDWSASSIEFQICVTSVRGEVEELARLMAKAGSDGVIRPEDYRMWPVFRGHRTAAAFADAFQQTFGQPLINSKLSVAEAIEPDTDTAPALVH